jgi:hypothetical protein
MQTHFEYGWTPSDDLPRQGVSDRALGYGNRLSLDVLRELRLILRLLRMKRMETEFRAIVAALCEAPFAIAAE